MNKEMVIKAITDIIDNQIVQFANTVNELEKYQPREAVQQIIDNYRNDINQLNLLNKYIKENLK